MNFTAPCIFGLESLVSDELKKMGAENVAAENGRVFFSGDEYLAARANYPLKIFRAYNDSRRLL